MKEFTPVDMGIETVSALAVVSRALAADEYAAYVGMDVHKDTIAVAVACPGREAVEYRGEIANKPKSVAKLVRRLSEEFDGRVLLFCYEAGPCGYGLYRQLISTGHECQAV